VAPGQRQSELNLLERRDVASRWRVLEVEDVKTYGGNRFFIGEVRVFSY
jgi:hypothetical protein